MQYNSYAIRSQSELSLVPRPHLFRSLQRGSGGITKFTPSDAMAKNIGVIVNT